MAEQEGCTDPPLPAPPSVSAAQTAWRATAAGPQNRGFEGDPAQIRPPEPLQSRANKHLGSPPAGPSKHTEQHKHTEQQQLPSPFLSVVVFFFVFIFIFSAPINLRGSERGS